MALQVWLPLNGDAHNQGLANVTPVVNGASVMANGPLGSCHSFDGSDDFISVTSEKVNNIFKGGNNPFSIAFWVYHADSTRAILFGDYNLTGAIQLNIELSTAHLVRFCWNAAPDKSFAGSSVGASKWTHVALVYDGTQVTAFINGNMLSDKYTGTLAAKNKPATSPFYIGRDSRTGTTALNGRISDFRIYDNALLEKDVKEIYNCKIIDICASENYCGFFYDNSGIIVNDLVSTGVTFSGNSMYFNGTSSLIRPANNIGGLNITGGTFSFWYMPPSKPTSNKIYFLDSKSQMTLGVFSSGNYFAVSVGINNKQPIYSTSNLVYGQLNNVIISYNSSYVPQFCLINGQQATAGNNDYWSGSGGLSIGGRYNDANTLANCYITRFTVYNKTFTLEEAQELYARGVGRDGALPEGYAQLEYIQATGGQYIDTGVKPCMNKIRCICDFAPMTTGDTAFFGTRGTYFIFYKLGDNYTWPISKSESIKGTLQTDVKYHLDWNKGKMFLVGPDGVLHKATRSNNTQDNSSMYIFNFNPLDGGGRTAKAKLYNFQIYFDDVLVRNFIPAKRLSDNVLGLYDTVTDALFTNGGSGSFTAGPVV